MKRLLLDTQAVLLWLNGSGLPRLVLDHLRRSHADDVAIHVSVASLWEISIKASSRKDFEFRMTFDEFAELCRNSGLRSLDIRPSHLDAVRSLPWHHKDPFDRMLVAQAKVEDLTVVGSDRIFSQYGVPVLWD